MYCWPLGQALAKHGVQHHRLDQQTAAVRRCFHRAGQFLRRLPLGVRVGRVLGAEALPQQTGSDPAAQRVHGAGRAQIQIELQQVAVVRQEVDEPGAAQIPDDGVAPAGQQGAEGGVHQRVQAAHEGGQLVVADGDDQVDVGQPVCGAGGERPAHQEVCHGGGGRQGVDQVAQDGELCRPVGVRQLFQRSQLGGRKYRGGHAVSSRVKRSGRGQVRASGAPSPRATGSRRHPRGGPRGVQRSGRTRRPPAAHRCRRRAAVSVRPRR